MVSVVKFFVLCMVAAAAGVAATMSLHFFHVPAGASTDVSYADFLSITLTALSLMITVLGLFLAAAGVIGWTTLESKLRSHSVDYFAQQLAKDGPLRKELEELFADIAYTGIDGLKAPEQQEDPYAD
ncbi:hypothetical protein NUH86_00970 [Sphingobium sp. JS3065]|uniref:hypothetical protein n=1 Tax=Sphingobium sp. JS3065 TaxID=2970925 RepID=UPI002264A148|nr:hypothetical protein [Sphingobium sp. JS3065]UZW55407.1 hypothetical protein NUH86_00970 [Sphingobium sp. JS3065]